MKQLVRKIVQRFRTKGLTKGFKSIVKDAAPHIVDANRELILMSLDLSNPKAHRQPNERERFKFELVPFEPKIFPKVIAMLERSERWRIDAMQVRLADHTPGFVALEDGQVVAYVFYEENTPDRPPQRDLDWLGIRLGDKEVYSFDSFIPPELRGRGIAILRASYQALYDLGYKTARGYVYSWDKAPLWTYRVTGWKEDRRLVEHRIGGRYAIVGGVLYKLNRFDRTRLLELPFQGLLPL